MTVGAESISQFHRAIYLTGPTGVGKTAVGVALAHRLGAEVAAMDSMSLYRGMNVGTAKPTIEERRGIPHHLIDRLDPWDAASVATYLDWAREAVQDVERRGKRVLFVGGTSLYLKALLRGLFDGPGADLERRDRLETEVDRQDGQALLDRLSRVDPTTAARLHPNDRRRIIRALEVFEATGRPISDWQQEHDQPALGVTVIALTRPRDELRDRISRRVLQMIADGLVQEVRALQAGPKPMGPVPSQAVGYREVIDLLEGRATLPRTIELIQSRTRQFAKRQMTWFRNLAEVELWPLIKDEPPELTADRLLDRCVNDRD